MKVWGRSVSVVLAALRLAAAAGDLAGCRRGTLGPAATGGDGLCSLACDGSGDDAPADDGVPGDSGGASDSASADGDDQGGCPQPCPLGTRCDGQSCVACDRANACGGEGSACVDCSAQTDDRACVDRACGCSDAARDCQAGRVCSTAGRCCLPSWQDSAGCDCVPTECLACSGTKPQVDGCGHQQRVACDRVATGCVGPPPAECSSRSVRREYLGTGTCQGATCSYSISDTACCCLGGACEPTATIGGQVGRVQSLTPMGLDTSQYSPWVMHASGWGSYLMYYCKNTPVGGVYRDRVWRTESWIGSGDGLTDWIGDQIVIEGSLNADDDLSCSPGVVIDPNGVWHMYYVTAARTAGMTLYLYHATASAPGVTWTKHGKIGGGFAQPTPGYIETPSPFIRDGRIVIYLVGPDGWLNVIESTDGYTGQSFTALRALPSPAWAAHGRVTRVGSQYFYVYSGEGVCCPPPAHVFLSVSNDGECFSPGQPLFAATGNLDWDGTFAWAPHLLVDATGLRVYYAGNGVGCAAGCACVPACDAGSRCFSSAPNTCAWWGANTSIGVRTFAP